ncbi:hypothetical protein PV10_07070 [Exophiala mesophila]|uniref:Enoyl reductase (ER) domain-containing protein n=1 Tax=Exophiala mesophila TaxID=212818 RepID=A0A0D1XNK7_EXOME|nr:uncharacterized protein PV10_07070 [Exophiala mesophila]KIV89691.1 hypothetical protein PV10_07070 [Exophiala mesophila]
MQLVNYAAWLPAPQTSLDVATAPFPGHEVGDDDIVIKNAAVAINPVDWKIQNSPNNPFGLSFPNILGQDVAGTVLEAGKNVKHVKVGDLVIANAPGLGQNDARYGGFQLYPMLKQWTVAKVPPQVAFTEAVVLPLSVSTAAAGLYLKSTLGLRYPSLDSRRPGPREEQGQGQKQKEKETQTLLLWGGSSSVGSSVVQLAVASGYQVVTTASPANYLYVKDLGAKFVLDYHNPDIVELLIQILKDTEVVGVYDAIGSNSSVSQSAQVLHALGGGKIASTVSVPDPDELPDDVEVTRISSGNIVSQEDGIVAKKIWQEFVSEALEKKVLRPRPDPLVVGKGLYYVEKGLDTQKEGVSARKVVVQL